MNRIVGSIYILTFPNKKQYVGQTIEGISKRMSGHRTSTRAGCSLLVHRAMRKYGLDAFVVKEFCTLECSQEYLDRLEQKAIEFLSTLAPNGYNITPGGRGGRGKMCKGKPGTMTGRRHSEETKAKISANNARKGKPLSEEHKAKIAEARRGKPHPHRGAPRSEETKKKMSAAKKKMSAATRAKMSKAKKIYWKSKRQQQEVL